MRSAGRKPKHERKVGPEERRGRGSGSARPPEQESAAWAELNIVEEGDEPEEDSEAEETEAPREKRGRFRRHWKHRLKRRPAFSSVHDFLNSLLSFRLLFEVFVQKVRWLFAMGVVCTLGFMFVLTTVKSFGASTTMSLNYEESVTGKTPNGARFSESEFLTQEYLEAILQATGLQDDLTTADLADCISISPTTSRIVTKEDDYYISSSYYLSVKLPWTLWGKITVQDFLDEICRVYLKRFTADYRVNNYLTVRNDQDGSYLSASGQSYSAIKKQVQNLQGYTLREYQSYIWEKGVAKNNFRCIDDLNELNRTLRWDEMSDSQKSAIYMTILDNYNNKMVSSVLIPTYDNDGAFYMSRTKIGIDDLALQANELLSSAVEAQKSIATNNTKVTALEQSTESYEVQMAQAMVDNITRQLADIVSATRELDADCYAQRIRSYLMFSEPQMSFMQRYNVKRSVMLAALVCAVCYLGAVVQACVRRQRQRMENE